MECREKPEDQASEKRKGDGETEDVEVERNFEHAGEEIIRNLLEQIESPERKEHAEDASDSRSQHAFGEKLEDDASAGGAERGANGNFFSSRGEAGEEKIGDVGTGDEEDATNRGEKREHHRPLLADQIFMEGEDMHSGFRIHLLGIRGSVTPVDDMEFLLRLGAGHTRFQPAKGNEKPGAALNDIGRQTFLLEHARQPDLVLREWKLEGGGHDADDGERRAVEINRLAKDAVVVSKTFLPKSVT